MSSWNSHNHSKVNFKNKKLQTFNLCIYLIDVRNVKTWLDDLHDDFWQQLMIAV